MDYQLLVVLHLLGLALLTYGFGVLLTTSSARLDENKKLRLPGVLTHGIGLLILIVTGFIMFFQVKYSTHAWIGIKFVIWLVLGGMIALIRRKPEKRNVWMLCLLILVAAAAYLGRTKAF
jgi:dipeptide/tripeptide permease